MEVEVEVEKGLFSSVEVKVEKGLRGDEGIAAWYSGSNRLSLLFGGRLLSSLLSWKHCMISCRWWRSRLRRTAYPPRLRGLSGSSSLRNRRAAIRRAGSRCLPGPRGIAGRMGMEGCSRWFAK